MLEEEYVVITPEDDDCMAATKAAIKRLPLPQRRLLLYYIEEGTYSAVAKILHCSVPTVSSKMKEIIKNLKKDTERVCGGS